MSGRLPDLPAVLCFPRQNDCEIDDLVSDVGAVSQDDIDCVKLSFAKLVPVAEPFTKRFYDNLFELAPEVRPLFRPTMIQQRDKLFSTLLTIVDHLDQRDAIRLDIEDLARRHVEYGTKAFHYPVVGEALLSAIAIYLGDDFTPEVRDAWRKTYFWLAGIMIEAAGSV